LVAAVNPHLLARLRIGLVIFFAILIQTTVGDDLRIGGVAPDLMVLVTICAGLTGGTEAGAWVGFWSGLAADLFLTSTPLGLSALTYCLIGASVGALRAAVLPESRLLTLIVAPVATAASVLLFVGLGDMLGQGQLLDAGRTWLVRVALVEAGWAVVLAIPTGWIYARAARGSVGVERLGPPSVGAIRPERLPVR
jgi:rod shape-determining protein MreD